MVIFGPLLFMVAMSDTSFFLPAKFMHYCCLSFFNLLGINFGISSGKKPAYGMHMIKNIIFERHIG